MKWLHLWNGMCTRTVPMLLVSFLIGCGDTSAPPMKPAYAFRPPADQVSCAEFRTRYDKLQTPIPRTRLEFVFGAPQERVELTGYDLPLVHSYRCTDDMVHILFGAIDGEYGAIEVHEGALKDEQLSALRTRAIEGAQAMRAKSLRQQVEHGRRRLEDLVEECQSARERILAHREDQRKRLTEAIQTLTQSHEQQSAKEASLVREQLSRLSLAARPPALQNECRNRNIRLKSQFQNQFSQLNSVLQSHSECAERFIQVLTETIRVRGRDFEPFKSRLELLTRELPEEIRIAQPPMPNPVLVPDAVEQGLDELQALRKKWQALKPTVLDADLLAKE